MENAKDRSKLFNSDDNMNYMRGFKTEIAIVKKHPIISVLLILTFIVLVTGGLNFIGRFFLLAAFGVFAIMFGGFLAIKTHDDDSETKDLQTVDTLKSQPQSGTELAADDTKKTKEVAKEPI